MYLTKKYSSIVVQVNIICFCCGYLIKKSAFYDLSFYPNIIKFRDMAKPLKNKCKAEGLQSLSKNL